MTIYHVHAGVNLVIVHEKQATDNLTHLLVKQNEFFKKMSLIGSGTFSFEISGDISLRCSENQYHLTQSYHPANILPTI